MPEYLLVKIGSDLTGVRHLAGPHGVIEIQELGVGEPVKNIRYAEEKVRIIEEMGIDYLISIPFTKEILSMSPQSFIKDILVDVLRIREAYCGFNYSFGYKAQGTPEVLMRFMI